MVESIFGGLTVTPDNDGMTLVLRSDGTFVFSGDQTIGVSGETPWGDVDGTVNATANVTGTYQPGSGNLTFTLESISGSGTFVGTLGGNSVSASLSLDQLGLDEIYGLSATAQTSCSTTKLTLDFEHVDWDF